MTTAQKIRTSNNSRAALMSQAKRYDDIERQAVRDRIRELRAQGKTYADVTFIMAAEGYKNPNGTPIDQSQVGSQLQAMRKIDANKNKGRHNTNPPAPVREISVENKPFFRGGPTVEHNTESWESTVNELLNMNANAATRIQIIKTYLEGLNVQ